MANWDIRVKMVTPREGSLLWIIEHSDYKAVGFDAIDGSAKHDAPLS
jgi:hypothetical protein